MSKKATLEHNIGLLEKQIAKKTEELAKLKAQAVKPEELNHDEAIVTLDSVSESINNGEKIVEESLKTENVEKKSLRATVVGWLSAAWSAVKSFTGNIWENATNAFVDVVLNPVAAQVAFGSALLFGIGEAVWMLAGELTAIQLAATPFIVLTDTIVFGFAGLGLTILAVFVKNTVGDWATSVWNSTKQAARSSWNWISAPFRKVETMKTETKVEEPKVETMKTETKVEEPKVQTEMANDEGVDHKRAEAVKNVKRVLDVTDGIVPAAA